MRALRVVGALTALAGIVLLALGAGDPRLGGALLTAGVLAEVARGLRGAGRGSLAASWRSDKLGKLMVVCVATGLLGVGLGVALLTSGGHAGAAAASILTGYLAAAALAVVARHGAYELRLGFRYLYGGKRDRSALIGAGLALLLVAMGIGITAVSSAKGLGVLAIVLGMLAFAVFGLLSTFSVFTSVSVLGVVFGVAALTVVLAVTTGFQEQFREKVLGVNAHVIIMKTEPAFPEYRNVMDKARAIDPDVLAVQPFIFAEMLVTRGKGQLSGVAIKGVDPELVKRVLDLEKHMTEGSIDSLAVPVGAGELPPIIMGKELARKLHATVGDDVTVVVPLSNVDVNTWRAKTSAPRTRKFRVTGIFYSGFDEYDRRLMYTTLHETQVLWGKGDVAMGVELKVRDVDRAAEIAAKLGAKLGEPPYQVQDWYELNHNLFTALTLQKLALTIILTLIIAVAAFNMVAALVLMVTDKTREIAILKSMGATSSSIAVVFQVVGLAIGGVGTAVGVGIGVATCFVVRGYGYHLDPKVYLIDRLPITVRPFEVCLVAGVTMAISVLATLYPSIKASGMRPVEGLRHD